MSFEQKIGRAFWYAFIVFLIPSIPHMATVFRDWEPVYGSDIAGIVANGFWWVVSTLGAAVIDGTIIYLSYLIACEVEQSDSNWGYTLFLGFCVVVLTGFSWQMNIWYAEANANDAATALGSAYKSNVLGMFQSKDVMPYMVSALPVLGIMFTIMAGRIKKAQNIGPEKPMSEQEYQAELARITQQKALKEARKGEGLASKLAQAKAAVSELAKTEDKRDTRQDEATSYLKNTPELLLPANEKRAITVLATYLKVNKKEALVYLTQSRAIIANEQRKVSEEKREDKLQKAIDFLMANGEDVADELLAQHLELARPASALFWKRKALEIIQQNASIQPEKVERNTGPLASQAEEETDQGSEENLQGNEDFSRGETDEMTTLDKEGIALVTRYPNAVSLLSTSDPTIHLQKVATAFDCTMKLLRNRVADGKLRRTRNPDIVYVDSVIEWAKSELLSRGKGKVISLESARNSQEKSEEKQDEKVSG